MVWEVGIMPTNHKKWLFASPNRLSKKRGKAKRRTGGGASGDLKFPGPPVQSLLALPLVLPFNPRSSITLRYVGVCFRGPGKGRVKAGSQGKASTRPGKVKRIGRTPC